MKGRKGDKNPAKIFFDKYDVMYQFECHDLPISRAGETIGRSTSYFQVVLKRGFIFDDDADKFAKVNGFDPFRAKWNEEKPSEETPKFVSKPEVKTEQEKPRVASAMDILMDEFEKKLEDMVYEACKKAIAEIYNEELMISKFSQMGKVTVKR